MPRPNPPPKDRVSYILRLMTNENRGKAVGISALVERLRDEQDDYERLYTKYGTRPVLQKLLDENVCHSPRPGYFVSGQMRDTSDVDDNTRRAKRTRSRARKRPSSHRESSVQPKKRRRTRHRSNSIQIIVQRPGQSLPEKEPVQRRSALKKPGGGKRGSEKGGQKRRIVTFIFSPPDSESNSEPSNDEEK